MNFRFFKRKPPPDEAVLPVAGLDEAVAAGRQEPDHRIKNPHLASVHKYGTAYISMVLGNILPPPYATIESSIAIMVRYGERTSEYHPGTCDLVCSETRNFTVMQLLDRTTRLAGMFPTTPQIFCIDQVSTAFMRSAAGFKKCRALWENQVGPEHVSLGIAALLAEFERRSIVLPSYHRKCNPAIESIRNELSNFNPKFPPSTALLAVIVAARCCVRYAPKAPIEAHLGPRGLELHRAAPRPDPSYLRRDPNLAARPKPESSELREARARGAYMQTTNYLGDGPKT